MLLIPLDFHFRSQKRAKKEAMKQCLKDPNLFLNVFVL